MADEPSFRGVAPSGAEAAVILPLQLTDALLCPDADQGKSGVPGALAEAVPGPMGVGLASRLAVQAAPVPAVQGVLHGEQVRPQHSFSDEVYLLLRTAATLTASADC